MNSNMLDLNGDNVWVETDAGDCKVYYYNAKTRETSWSKPENAKIINQEQLASLLQQSGTSNVDATKTDDRKLEGNNDSMKTESPLQSTAAVIQTPPTSLYNQTSAPFGQQYVQNLPPNMVPQFSPFNPPPNFRGPQGGMPWSQQVPGIIPNIESAKQAFILLVDHDIRMRAAEYSEFKTPEGKIYYYSSKTQQSIWEKPKEIIDLEEAIENIRRQQEIEKAAKNGEVRSETIIEDETKELREEEKVSDKKVEPVRDKSKPISSTPVSGTTWCVVWTGDGRVFYYNPSTKTSVWERPADLKGRSDVDKLVKGPPKSVTETETNEEKRMVETELEKPAKKQKKSDDDVEKENRKDPASEAELMAAKQRETMPLNERIQMFKNMLVEKEVSAFSTWEKELHKIVFDPRYLLLTSKDRKQVFERYIKDRAEEERKEKRQRIKQQRDDFRKLLEEVTTDSKISFSEFGQRYGRDERFKNIEKMRDRESMFNEYINELRKKEKDEKALLREKAKHNFLELLKEQTQLNRASRWNEIKEKIRADTRYKCIDSSTTKEDWFRTYVSQLPAPIIENEENNEDTKEREKRERVEASIREREKEVAKELSTHLKERDKEREQHKHAEAVLHYNALLTDLVRSSDKSWREARKILKKDHRYELVELLTRDEKEQLFNTHIKNLYEKIKLKFRDLLNETREITMTSTWRDVRRLIKDDPRYKKFVGDNERRGEREFKDYIRDKLDESKKEFKELLKETKIVTYKSKKMIEESEQHLQDIIAVLQNDKRYLVLDCIEDERRQLLINYIDDLDRKGPPPPPTASEPARRPNK